MAFEELNFTRDWTVTASAEEGGFPTYEPDEATVRADMQFLYNEIRDFINGKLVGVLNTEGASSITTSSGKTIEVALAEFETKLELLMGSLVPDDGTAVEVDLDMGMNRITNLADPVEDADAVTMGYLDNTLNDKMADCADYVLRAGGTAPENPKMLWLDGGVLKYFDGVTWVAIAGGSTSTVATLTATDDGNGNVTLSNG